jgi:UDP-N-acetylmuramate dehydrogenase
LEHFSGIPSTVGGALWQNLHFLSPGRDRTVFLEEYLQSAQILTESGVIDEVGVDHFRFGYDDSILQRCQEVVVSANFRVNPAKETDIAGVIDANLAWRRERHPDPSAFPSAGSIFKKLKGAGAGRLIDQCGLKGRIFGGAQISPRHANFIVNLGEATSRDVLNLVEQCQSAVRARFEVALEMEVARVGET